MKKTILVLLALALVCALAGCRGGSATSTTGAAATTQPATQPTTAATTQSTTAATESPTDMSTTPTMDNGNGPLTTDPVTGNTNTEGTSGSTTGAKP